MLWVDRGELGFEVLDKGAAGDYPGVHAGNEDQEEGCEGYDDVKGDREDGGDLDPDLWSGEY